MPTRGLRAELLSGAAELAETVLSRSPRSAIGGPDTAGSVLHGLYWLVANLAERSPLLLAIDDLQWADGPSLRFLVYLARRLEGLPVALAVATRTAEPAAAPELVQALELEAPPPVLRPAPLSDEGVSAVVRDGLGDASADELCAACAEATGGNPFLLSELLASLSFDRTAATSIDAEAIRKRIPERISASLLLRVGRLGHDAPALARAVAVLGPDAEHRPGGRACRDRRRRGPHAVERADRRRGLRGGRAAALRPPDRPLRDLRRLLGRRAAVAARPRGAAAPGRGRRTGGRRNAPARVRSGRRGGDPRNAPRSRGRGARAWRT